jgi:uncharacterized protein (DUF433 family)
MTAETTNQPGQQAGPADMLRFFCDHLVVLGGSYVPLDAQRHDAGAEKFFAFSGFILSVREVWCLVTAGHAIQELEDNLGARRIRLANCCLADYFGSKPRVAEPMPFDYADCGKIFIDDEKEGLDFALLTIRPFYQMSLEANGIRAISEVNWVAQDVSACELFALLGLPNCLVDKPWELVPHGDRFAGVINPALVTVEATTLPPDEMPDSRFPWFVGRVGAATGLPDVVGMSGGPIFGFAKRPGGLWEYWIVAVQSRWRSSSRVIFGCPLRTFAQLVEQELQRQDAAGTQDDLETTKTCALLPNEIHAKPGSAGYGGAGVGPHSDISRLPRETPVEPWKHLVARRHPWRKQLFLKGRNMTVRQLVGTVNANKFSEEQAATDLGLPVEAIREAFAYFDANPEVIELDAAYERYLRKMRGVGRGPQPVPR